MTAATMAPPMTTRRVPARGMPSTTGSERRALGAAWVRTAAAPPVVDGRARKGAATGRPRVVAERFIDAGPAEKSARRVPERATLDIVARPRQKPPALAPGAVLGIVAPASPLYNRSDLSRARANLRRLGFEIKLGRRVLEQRGYLAGDDAARADDFMRVWSDPEVDGVLCMRGGYGCARIVDRLDYEQIAARPKVFVGYSDITALHLALGRRANLVTFYGPMLRSFVKPPGPEPSYSERGFVHAVREVRPLGRVEPDPDDPWVETITGGTVEGELVGGCLSLL